MATTHELPNMCLLYEMWLYRFRNLPVPFCPVAQATQRAVFERILNSVQFRTIFCGIPRCDFIMVRPTHRHRRGGIEKRVYVAKRTFVHTSSHVCHGMLSSLINVFTWHACYCGCGNRVYSISSLSNLQFHTCSFAQSVRLKLQIPPLYCTSCRSAIRRLTPWFNYWCCFYYFMRNGLEALLIALCTRNKWLAAMTHVTATFARL